jgi:hypothetical protein
MYNADAIQEAIDRDPAIGPAEAKAIHALLRGRTRGRSKAAPEAAPFGEAVHTCGGPNFGRLAPVTAGCPRCDELRAGGRT